MSETNALADQLRKMIVAQKYGLSDRLPPERELCQTFDVTRHQMRTALASLEKNGLIWRHVGRGTFVGPRPVLNLEEVAYLSELVSAEQIVTVRHSIEPELARLAAENANKSDLVRIRDCATGCTQAADWRGYEAWDTNLHLAIARAAHNKLYLYFFETLNVVRRGMVWKQTRTTPGPAKDYCSFEQHESIVAAIETGDARRAKKAMSAHLKSVYARVFPEMR
ncbi:FadR/GntR family transcriptional regulator [uncultured Roseobacter sp.]|uniref:FadR/GntR family transcriptional regulator n=1 Tax=uncultured Roseobacter sp. TaxID=114847 RepID=UPI00260BD676|nr:FadR/GntR family transcriptional regulator [uncultured Roseobacter sp.]